MAEEQVSIGGISHLVPTPFLVLATQNPIESEGVYPLPEAQRDRFLMKILIDYPSDREEHDIVRRVSVATPLASSVLDPDSWRDLQQTAADVFVHDAIVDYAVRLVVATRRPTEHSLGRHRTVHRLRRQPAGHARARRFVAGTGADAGPSLCAARDVFDVSTDGLRHRLVLSYEAMASEVTAEQIVRHVRSTVWAPQITPTQRGELVVESPTDPVQAVAS